MEKKVVLFDLDNTLINRQAAAYNMYTEVVLNYVKGAKEDELVRETAVQRLMTWDEFGTLEKEKVYQNFIDAYHITEIDAYQLAEEWSENFGDYAIPFEKARETVLKIKEKYHVGMVTNGSVHMQARKLAKSGLEDLFEEIIISGTAGIHKPDQAIFVSACEAMNCLPEEAYYVGDTFYCDAFGAMQAGIKPIWIWSDPNRISKLPILRINVIEDLLKII